jgi:hypothetical protein
VSRKRYSYTTAETPTRLKKTITYKYEDDCWADLLTEYDGQTRGWYNYKRKSRAESALLF